jgi:Phage tail assembly chaperone protein
MRLTIITADKGIGIDGQFILGIQEELSWIPSNIRAVQWYETWGEIEYGDGSPNEKIEELGIYEQAVDTFNNEKQRLEDEEKAKAEATEAARDYWKEFRDLRNKKLTECDWTQTLDAPLTEEQKTSWINYRQELRDLPGNTEDPKNPIWPPTPTP